jgi:hypothetical protein
VGITVYNDNFAVVKERRQMDFAAGQNTLKFTDVATAIDPTTVSFECLSAPGTVSILEQNYQYDLASTDTLLKRYMDKDIELVIRGYGSSGDQSQRGKLVSATPQNVVMQSTQGANKGLLLLDKTSIRSISLSELPKDLVTRPTLVWLAQSAKQGSLLCQVTYTTDDVKWNADYTAILDADGTHLDLSGWVTIDNKSGTSYNDAEIKLVAGDVRRIRPEVARPMFMAKSMRMNVSEAAQGFEEKAFAEYHLYTLGRKSTIHDNETKQIELITPAKGIDVNKIFVYDRQKNEKKVQIKLEFANTKANHLGIALPKGKVRAFTKDPADGMLEFVGEDEIDHTAAKETLKLYIGDAFDIVPEYKLLNNIVGERRHEQSHQVELRNRKDSAVRVFVDETFPEYVNWDIVNANMAWDKRDAKTARFTVNIPADSNATVKYTTIETW